MLLIAILGRGIQFDPEWVSDHFPRGWEPTGDLEMCAPDGTHLLNREPVDDRSPNCRIGGGQLNLLAGAELYTRSQEETILCCAYGNRSAYLVDAGGPSESEVMSVKLKGMIHELTLRSPEILVWPKEKVIEGRSNTYRELQNIFELANNRGVEEVKIVSVSVHLPRVAVFVANMPEEMDLPWVTFHASEQVLIDANYLEFAPDANYLEFAPRVLAMYASQAYQRTAYFEERGTKAFLADTYEATR